MLLLLWERDDSACHRQPQNPWKPSSCREKAACVLFPNSAFVMARKCMFIWSLWWLFLAFFLRAEGRTFQRVMQGTEMRHFWEIVWQTSRPFWVCFVLSLSSSCPVNLQFCLWFPLWLHVASGSLACSRTLRSFVWVNWNCDMELESHFT